MREQKKFSNADYSVSNSLLARRPLSVWLLFKILFAAAAAAAAAAVIGVVAAALLNSLAPAFLKYSTVLIFRRVVEKTAFGDSIDISLFS